jgi:hypothetical protein
VTDDSIDAIGGDVEVRVEHLNAVNATKTKESAEETRRGHRRRLKKIMDWWRAEYPAYFEVGTRVLSEEERNNQMMFYFGSTRDIVYEGLRVDMVLAFMAANKTKSDDGKMYSFTHMRKMHDAILFGARTKKKVLSSSYYSEMDSFLASFKKETADARRKGNVDEKSADPICYTLFRLILIWAVEKGNMFVWVWTILQWNLMARSISIDPLALHNISISEDHFVMKHDSTKTDKEGDKTHNKAVYCNPLDPVVCIGVSLGIWLSLEQHAFVDGAEWIFIRRNAKVGGTAHRYCDQLMLLMKESEDVVKTYIRNMSSHGLRKGSATHVASATTAPPPISSIASRGDWSLGKVLDVYWQFADAGDAYLGRCLCGLDPNDSKFSTLPPHWNLESPVNDDDVKEGLAIMYGVIATNHPASIGVLVRLLASVTYASDWLRETAAKSNPGHPFFAVPLLQNPELLSRLKAKVTVEPTRFMSTATGVPPHVKQINVMASLLTLCQTTLVKVNEQSTTVRQTIFDAFEVHAIESGHITRDQIVTIMEEFQTGIRNDVQTQIATLNHHGYGGVHQPLPQRNNQLLHLEHESAAGTIYSYSGRFWDVPEGFLFPAAVKRDLGWKLWLQGMPGYTRASENGEMIHSPVKPFRKLVPSRLPKKLADTYKLHWRPIFNMMEEGIRQDDIPQNMPSIEVVENLYTTATEYLKTRVSYVFDSNNKLHHNTWTLATWSKYVGRNMITKRGSANDKANLPEETRFNRSHTGRKRRAPERQQQNPARRTRRERQVLIVNNAARDQQEPAVATT